MKTTTRWFAGLILGFAMLAAPLRAQSIVGTVEMESWNGFTSNLSAFCQSAGMPFALAGLNGMTRQLFKSADLSGIDLARPIRLYLVQPAAATNAPARPPLAVYALPVNGDGHAYLDRVVGSYSRTTQVGAVSLFTESAGRGGGQRLAAQMFKDVMLVSDRTEAVATAAALLQKGPAPASPRVVGDVRVALDVASLMPLVEAHMTQMRRQMGAFRPPPGAGPEAGSVTNMAAVLDAEMDVVLSLMRQTQSVAIGFKASESDGTFYLRLDARPGTPLAAAMACLKPADPSFAALLPSNTLYGATGGGLGALHVLAKPYVHFMQRIYRAMPGMAGLEGPFGDVLMKSSELYTGDYAIGLLPDARSPNGFLLAEIFAIADAEHARTLMHDNLATIAKLNEIPNLGMRVEQLPSRTYAGTEVTVCRYVFSPATNGAALMPPATAMMMGSMTGLLASCTLEMAVMGKKTVVAFGRAGAIDQVIDRVRSGGDGAFLKRAQTVFSDVQTPAVEIGNLALVATIARAAHASSSVPPAQLAMLPESGEGIGFIAFHQENTWIGALRLTASEVQALMRAAPVARGMFMKTMSQDRPQPRGGPRRGPAGGPDEDDDQPPAPGGARPPAAF